MLFTLCDSHEYPVFTAIQSFMMIAEDLLSIARHLLHYIAQYCQRRAHKGVFSRVRSNRTRFLSTMSFDEFAKFL